MSILLPLIIIESKLSNNISEKPSNQGLKHIC